MKQKVILVDGSEEYVEVNHRGYPIFAKVIQFQPQDVRMPLLRSKYHNNMFAARSKQHPI